MSTKNKIDRRGFTKLFAVGAGALLIPNSTKAASSSNSKKAKPLKKGSKIGLIAPGTRATAQYLDYAKSNLTRLGFEVFHTDKLLSTHGNFAGTDDHRVSEIHRMYSDKSVDGVWAIYGGYGATRILDKLDFGLIKRNPKPLLGYSDITALLNTIQQKTGSPCFHSLNAPSNFSPIYNRNMLAPIYGIDKPFTINLSDANIKRGETDEAYKYKVITQGKTKGGLVGGNLSLLVSLVGTKHAVETKNKLVFIEDVGEAPYRIDRMLTHLISSGFFKDVKGVILGIFSGCDLAENDKTSFNLKQVVTERLKQLNVPSVYGFSFGHIREQCLLPIGVKAELDTDAKTITLLKDAF